MFGAMCPELEQSVMTAAQCAHSVHVFLSVRAHSSVLMRNKIGWFKLKHAPFIFVALETSAAACVDASKWSVYFH